MHKFSNVCNNDFSFISRRPISENYDEPQGTRYALDEKFIQELEAEEIIKPELNLKPYNWTTDHEEVKFKRKIQDPSQYVTWVILLISDILI